MFTALYDAVTERLAHAERVVVGIAGPPGAGKSTLARELGHSNERAVCVPMDGFHLANEELRRLGRSDRKGAPDTFDDKGYVALLKRIKQQPDEVIYAPSFDHVMNEPIAGSIPVFPDARLIITEGNYLLYWADVKDLLDLTVHIDVASQEQRIAGLIARQIEKGLTPDAAREWVMRSDEANADLVKRYAHLADLRLTR